VKRKAVVGEADRGFFSRQGGGVVGETPVPTLIITHIFWSDSKDVDDRLVGIVELIYKLCNADPLHKRSKKDVGNDKVPTRL
jgi:hypothetical protein